LATPFAGGETSTFLAQRLCVLSYAARTELPTLPPVSSTILSRDDEMPTSKGTSNGTSIVEMVPYEAGSFLGVTISSNGLDKKKFSIFIRTRNVTVADTYLIREYNLNVGETYLYEPPGGIIELATNQSIVINLAVNVAPNPELSWVALWE